MLNNQKLISYLIVRENKINTYLNNFDIAKDVFNPLFITDIEALRKYCEYQYNRAVTKVMDDEYVGITFDNLDTIKEVLEENEKAKSLAM